MKSPSFPTCTQKRIFYITLFGIIIFMVINFYNVVKISEEYQNDSQNVNHLSLVEISEPEMELSNVNHIRIVELSESERRYNYHTVNKTHPCTITVVIFDPRLSNTGDFRSKHALFTAIESVALNVVPKEGVCLSIQTSACNVRSQNTGTDDSPEARAYESILSNVGSGRYPHFREYLEESGRIRVSIIDSKKYLLQSCSNFMSPNHAWMNIHYWEDEFVSGVDSDLLLFIQDDSVLCEPIEIERWSDIAFVGAPWPNVHGSVPKPSMCEFLKTKFSLWMKSNSTTTIEFCHEEKAISGNGGLAIRRRSYMEKAIRACPHIRFSGLSAKELNEAGCYVNENVPEDVYFAAILRYLNAPLPTAFEASLFSSEMIMPHQVATEWGQQKYNETLMKLLARRRLTNQHYKKFEYYMNVERHRNPKHFIPIGFHNTWFYHDPPFLNYIHGECPAFNVIRYSH